MSTEMGRFDPDMQMFVKPPQEPDIRHLEFTKSLVDSGKLEGDTSAEVIVFKPKETREEHMARMGGD